MHSVCSHQLDPLLPATQVDHGDVHRCWAAWVSLSTGGDGPNLRTSHHTAHHTTYNAQHTPHNTYHTTPGQRGIKTHQKVRGRAHITPHHMGAVKKEGRSMGRPPRSMGKESNKHVRDGNHAVLGPKTKSGFLSPPQPMPEVPPW